MWSSVVCAAGVISVFAWEYASAEQANRRRMRFKETSAGYRIIALMDLLSKRWLKIPVFLLCLIPIAELIWRMYRQDLGANPVEYVTHQTGIWSLRFLAITLAITPARKLLRIPELIRYRRMMGLYAFFYAWMHLMTYVVLDKQFDIAEMTRDILKRRFIMAGMTSLLLMLPLAITSTAGWIRRLGGKRWQLLHRLIYGSAVAGVIHYYWLVKSDVRSPLLYAAIVSILLLARLTPAASNSPGGTSPAPDPAR